MQKLLITVIPTIPLQSSLPSHYSHPYHPTTVIRTIPLQSSLPSQYSHPYHPTTVIATIPLQSSLPSHFANLELNVSVNFSASLITDVQQFEMLFSDFFQCSDIECICIERCKNKIGISVSLCFTDLRVCYFRFFIW